jgi:type II secretory pathway component GspD/PulD (secretin)
VIHGGNVPRCMASGARQMGRVASRSLLTLALAGALLSAAEAGPGSTAQPSAAVHAQVLRLDAARESAAGRPERARDLLRLAAQAEPRDVSLAAQAGTLEPQPDRLDRAEQSALIAQCRSVVAIAEGHSRQGRGDHAASLLTAAAAVLRSVAARSSGSELSAEADRLTSLATAARAVANDQGQLRAAQSREQARDLAANQTDAEVAKDLSSRAESIARIEAMEARAQYDRALVAARRLVNQLPGDGEVAALHARLIAARHEQLRLNDTQRADDLRQELTLLTERSLMPTGIDGLPIFPSDWEHKGDRSGAITAVEPMPAWEQALRRALNARTNLQVEGVPGSEILASLAATQRISIIIDPKVAAAKDVALTLNIPSIRLDHLLTWVTASMGTRWSLLNGAVYIGDQADTRMVTQIHDISALLYQGLDAPTRQIALTATESAGFATVNSNQGKALTSDEIIDIIRSAVSPLIWKESEGAAIVTRGNDLVVTAPSETHRLLREFIRAQENQQLLQVRVDARWLEISDSFIEEIGVDWTGVGTLLDTQYSPGARTERSNSLTAGSVANLLPSTAMAINPVTAGTGLSMAAKFFGVDQLSVVLQALERKQKGRVVEQSVVTTLNGVRASVFNGEQAAYISTYEVVSGNLDPTIKVLNTGLNIEVRPLVSSDRKYVTLELTPTVANANFFVEYVGGVRVIPGTRAANQGNEDEGDDIIITAGDFPIELPNIFVRTAGTTVTLPDKGSVLMGGFSRGLDEFSVARVPYLGSLPFLGRLFGKRGRYSDHRQLYLLTSTTILSYDELEAKL